MAGMIKIEVSPTGKCVCKECDALIPKGSIRLSETFGAGKWQKTYRYCKKCGQQHLQWIILTYTEELKLFEDNKNG